MRKKQIKKRTKFLLNNYQVKKKNKTEKLKNNNKKPCICILLKQKKILKT